MHEAFGLDPLLVGVVLSATALVIIFGGIHRIANVSSVLVPVMAIGYFLLAIVIVIMNIEHIPHVMKVIVTNALGLEQGVGGALGDAIMTGVKRGLFSNEAGEGSAPNVAATATVSHGEARTHSGSGSIHRHSARLLVHRFHHPHQRTV